MVMTNNITHKFINRNGTINYDATMEASYDARTDALRSLIKTGAIFLKSLMQVGNFKPSLTKLKT